MSTAANYKTVPEDRVMLAVFGYVITICTEIILFEQVQHFTKREQF